MPFHWIESALAVSFAAVWAFIGLTLVGDRIGEVRERRMTGHGPHYRGRRPKKTASRRSTRSAA